jgi:hypothetical protein
MNFGPDIITLLRHLCYLAEVVLLSVMIIHVQNEAKKKIVFSVNSILSCYAIIVSEHAVAQAVY